jgi:hypothetical protein
MIDFTLSNLLPNIPAGTVLAVYERLIVDGGEPKPIGLIEGAGGTVAADGTCVITGLPEEQEEEFVAAAKIGETWHTRRFVIGALSSEPATKREVTDTRNEVAAKTLASLTGVTAVIEKPPAAVPAVAVKGVEVANGSKALKSPGGLFTPAMNGQLFYLIHGGPILVTGTNAWEASPLFGTFTYVSPGEGTLSVAAGSTVTAGEVIIGPDSTARVQTAIKAGVALVGAGVNLIVAGELFVDSRQALIGEGKTSRLFSVTKMANVVTSAWTSSARIENLEIYGNGWGEQPANVDPGEGVTPNWAKSGSGLILARAYMATVSNVHTYFCAGNATTAERNGVAGIWATMGCERIKVVDCGGKYNRNAINEDNYFGTTYAPLNNTYVRPITDYNYVGFGADSGSLAKGLVVESPIGNRNVISGVEIHRTNFATVLGPRCEENGLVANAPGLYIHGNEDAVAEYQQVTVVSPQCHLNGSHGIKVSEHVTNWKLLGGVSSRNQFHGIYVNNKAHHGEITTVTRDNGLGGEFDGVHITDSLDVYHRARSYDDQEGPTQKWGIKADGSSDEIVIDDASTFSGNTKGSVSLAGTKSRRGPVSAATEEAKAEGLRWQTGARGAGILSVALTTKKARYRRRFFRAGEVITNLYVHVAVAATEEAKVTYAGLAVMSSTGVILGKTGNLKAQMLATGIRGGALEAAYTIPEDGYYYLYALLVGTGVPSLGATTSGATGYSAQVLSGALPEAGAENAEKETATALGALAGSGTVLWFGGS